MEFESRWRLLGIASNSKCDLESQLGFLVEEEKTIPWCGMNFIPY